MAQPLYKKYASDEDKAKVYDHRLTQAEAWAEKWRDEVERDIARYEAQSGRFARTADGHAVGAPTDIGIIDSLYAAYTAVEVDVAVTPRGNGTADQAYVATGALRQEWYRCKVPQRAPDAVKDAILAGLGWVKVGYEFYEQEQELPRTDDDIKADVQRLFDQAKREGSVDKLTADVIMDLVPVTATQNVVLQDRIVFDYVPWDMVLWDPTAKRPEDLKWVAQKTFMDDDELKQNPTFRAYLARNRMLRKFRDFKPDTALTKDILGQHGDAKREDERHTVYTIWDFETGTVCSYRKGADFLLNEAPNPLAINDDIEDKSPFVPLNLRRTPSRFRGVSAYEVMRDTLAEEDIYHSRLGTYLERMAPKVIAKARTIGATGKQGMQSQEYGAVVELEEGAETTDILPFNPPQLMSEMYAMPEKLQNALREATGVNELQRGLFPDRKRTATETAEVVNASTTRQSEARLAIENFYRAIARRILQFMQLNYEQERIVRLVDDAGEFAWTFTSDDITFGFDLELSLTPREEKSWQQRRDEALAVLNIVGPLAQPGADGTSPVDVTELLRWVLGELNIPRKVQAQLLNLPEEMQQQALGALQTQAAQANAAAGLPRPDMVPGPLDQEQLAAATNQGTIPPEVLAAAQAGGPLSPLAVEEVSENVGVAT